MKAFISILATIACVATFGDELKLTLSKDIRRPVSFEPKSNYLQLKLPFSPVAQLRGQLEDHLGFPLKHRGEAHVTVITPPEFSVLSSVKEFGIEEINEIARRLKIQKADLELKCVGRSVGKAGHAKAGWRAYYVVVKSEKLEKIREEIFSAYQKAGGEPSHFDPESFHPHITVGFTNNDIYLQDGVYKGLNSCRFSVEEK